MKLEGALIKEQGVTFVIVVVKWHVTCSEDTARKAISSFSNYFPRIPIVLMAQDARGVPTYRGRRDLVKFLAKVPLGAILWKQFTFS